MQLHECRFGESLDPTEQEWIVWEINQFLAGVRGTPPSMADMPDTEAPEVGLRFTK